MLKIEQRTIPVRHNDGNYGDEDYIIIHCDSQTMWLTLDEAHILMELLHDAPTA